MNGDTIGGDKVAGDKVLGDKIVHTYTEGDYYALLAEGWSRSERGQLKYVDKVQLKAMQARLQLSSERAQELEREVRVALAEELFSEIPRDAFECRPSLLLAFDGTDGPSSVPFSKVSLLHRNAEVLRQLTRVVFLDENAAVSLLVRQLPRECLPDMERLRSAFLITNDVQSSSTEFDFFQRFLMKLETALAADKS